MAPTPLKLNTHGVLIRYQGVGCYLIGASGIGKSEAALELIYEGAQLICDDAPEFIVKPGIHKVFGCCQKNFLGLMHIREIGLINMQHLLGNNSIIAESPVDFIIEMSTTTLPGFFQSQCEPELVYWTYQSINIPGIVLTCGQNRNRALLIKTAIMLYSQYITN